MRIIAGRYKGQKLSSVRREAFRPTKGKTKEALFSIVGSLTGQSFLDLFAGSGAIGLEAVSRGCQYATFVEIGKRACQKISENIEKLNCKSSCFVIKSSVGSFLQSASGSYDVIYLDPPYNKGLVAKTLKQLTNNSSLFKANSLIIVEHSKDESVGSFFEVEKNYKYKDTQISIISCSVMSSENRDTNREKKKSFDGGNNE